MNHAKHMTLFLLALLASGCEHRLPQEARPAGVLTGDLSLLTEPEACATCHPDHYAEWRGSMHAYAAVDPVFIEMQKLGQTETGGKVDQFCVQCHSPIASKLGLTPPFYENADLPAVGTRGVSCQACHRIEQVEAHRNAEFRFGTEPVIFGPIADPVDNSFHKSRYHSTFESSDLCGACHNVVNPRDVTIENTYGEWERSPAAAAGQQCQDCHMPVYRGRAATNGPTRDVHRHFFVGVDQAMIAFPDTARQARLVRELLRSAAEIAVNAPASVPPGGILPIEVTITSRTAGHHLPSGAVADRQMWLAVTVKERDFGRIIYRSGQLDANGDLLDRHSEISPNADFDLVAFGQQMSGADGSDVFFSWQAHDERTVTIPPLAEVHPNYLAIVPADATGPLELEVKLRFRSFPPFLLRKLQLPDIAARLPIIDMAVYRKTVTLQTAAHP